MRHRIGIAMLRRKAKLVLVSSPCRSPQIRLETEITRQAAGDADLVLARLLSQLPKDFRRCPVALALSNQDLACGDTWPLPASIKATKVATLAPPLCEARCTGESLEELFIDVIERGSRIQGIAIRRDLLAKLVAAATSQGFEFSLISAVPATIAAVFAEHSVIEFSDGGEHIEVGRKDGQTSWRSFPIDGADSAGTLKWQDLEIPFPQVAAFAAAMVDPDVVPNVLGGAPGALTSARRRFRGLRAGLAAAAALFFLAAGVTAHRKAQFSRNELDLIERSEVECWGRFLPSQEPQVGRLAKAMERHVAEIGEGSDSVSTPSALSFWIEIGRHLPDPEKIGLVLESLDLAPDGGRLSARVETTREDPLRYAAHLEEELNRSQKVSVRGDYELRKGKVQVRLRMNPRSR